MTPPYHCFIFFHLTVYFIYYTQYTLNNHNAPISQKS